MTYAAELVLNSQDRLIDLKVALLESKLADLYDGVRCQLHRDLSGKPNKMLIEFANEYDMLHWFLTIPQASINLDYVANS